MGDYNSQTDVLVGLVLTGNARKHKLKPNYALMECATCEVWKIIPAGFQYRKIEGFVFHTEERDKTKGDLIIFPVQAYEKTRNFKHGAGGHVGGRFRAEHTPAYCFHNKLSAPGEKQAGEFIAREITTSEFTSGSFELSKR